MRGRIDDSRTLTYIVLGLAISAAAVVGGLVGVSRITDTVKQQTAERILSIAALCVSEAPTAAPAVAELLDGDTSPEAVAHGMEILGRYGLRPAIVARIEPGLSAAGLLPWLVLGTTLLAGVGAAGLAVLALRRVYRSVDDLTEVTARIAEGTYRLAPDLEIEGNLGRLSHEIRNTAHRLAEQTERANAGKDLLQSFLSDVSHQLKTPIASIRLYNELLLQLDRDKTDRATQFLERNLSQIERMEWLVKNLLIEARMEAGALPLTLKPAPIGPTLEEAVSAFTERAAEENRRLSVAIPPNDPAVPHDRRWLVEAVSNVVKNALDHTPENGTVSVSVLHTAVFARIEVADTGTGIPIDELPHVFDRFYRGRRTPDGHTSGTGLGLALAKAIVDRHGGIVSAESLGEGARFTITLPRLTKS